MLWLISGISFALGYAALLLGLGQASLFVAALPVLVAPTLVFARELRRNRDRWADELPAALVEGVPAYRSQPIVPGHVQRVPARIRLAAASCYAFGIQFVPGLALGLVGLFFTGIGLVSLPGLYVAYRMWRAGTALLERTEESLAQVASAAHSAQMLNIVLLVMNVLALILALFGGEAGPVVALLGLLAVVGAGLAHATWILRVHASLVPARVERSFLRSEQESRLGV